MWDWLVVLNYVVVHSSTTMSTSHTTLEDIIQCLISADSVDEWNEGHEVFCEYYKGQQGEESFE